jgi:hypothetical protein
MILGVNKSTLGTAPAVLPAPCSLSSNRIVAEIEVSHRSGSRALPRTPATTRIRKDLRIQRVHPRLLGTNTNLSSLRHGIVRPLALYYTVTSSAAPRSSAPVTTRAAPRSSAPEVQVIFV